MPPNLYRRSSGYYIWRDPRSGKFHGLGRDLRKAVAEAVEANVAVAQLTQHRRLIDTLTGRADRAMSLWIACYRDEVLANRDRAESTRESDRQKLRTIDARFGSLQIDAITIADIADFLREYEQAGKSRMAVAMRTVLTDCFRAAIAMRVGRSGSK